jgi:hypothetical protein
MSGYIWWTGMPDQPDMPRGPDTDFRHNGRLVCWLPSDQTPVKLNIGGAFTIRELMVGALTHPGKSK